MLRRTFLGTAAALAGVAAPAWQPLLNGRDVSGWHGRTKSPNEWFTATSVQWSRDHDPKKLHANPSPGGIILNGPAGKTVDLITDQTFGDIELQIEFLIPQGSNSGVYLQGLYEIQIFDSYGVKEPHTSDCGAIYHRWINEKPVGGSPPKVNASLPPGQWQSFHAWFRAPRFDRSGKKTENARFLKVEQNGKLVQENVELEGGTRSHIEIPEAPKNPLMLQGDHGPVAFRKIEVRPLGRT